MKGGMETEYFIQRGRQVAIVSAGNPEVTFNLVDFYHKEGCLMGVDTLKLSFGESAEIFKALLSGFKEGIFSAPPVETVSLDGALNAYRLVGRTLGSPDFCIRDSRMLMIQARSRLL